MASQNSCNQSNQEDLDRCEIGLTSLHDSYVCLYCVSFSVRSLNLFSCFTRVYEGHFMLCYKKEL